MTPTRRRPARWRLHGTALAVLAGGMFAIAAGAHARIPDAVAVSAPAAEVTDQTDSPTVAPTDAPADAADQTDSPTVAPAGDDRRPIERTNHTHKPPTP